MAQFSRCLGGSCLRPPRSLAGKRQVARRASGSRRKTNDVCARTLCFARRVEAGAGNCGALITNGRGKVGVDDDITGPSFFGPVSIFSFSPSRPPLRLSVFVFSISAFQPAGPSGLLSTISPGFFLLPFPTFLLFLTSPPPCSLRSRSGSGLLAGLARASRDAAWSCRLRRT